MGQARGIITREELEAYGGADIMLLDGASGSTGSGGSAGGTVEWSIQWNSKGFTGKGWDYAEQYKDFETLYKTEGSGALEAYFATSLGGVAGSLIFDELRKLGPEYVTCTIL